MPKPLLHKSIPIYQLPKIYLHFQNKFFFIKTETLDFKSIPDFPLTTIPLLSHHMFLDRKTQKIVSVLKKLMKIK